MTRVAVMQPYFFPYLGYLQLLDAADVFVVYDDVQFIKGGWINRNFIQLNREPHRISLALGGASANKLINQIDVVDEGVKLRKTVAMAYARAPRLDQGLAILDDTLSTRERNLGSFLGASIENLAATLRADVDVVYSSAMDYDRTLTGQARLLGLLESLGATQYTNSAGGRALYDADSFAARGIALSFLDSQPPPYRQFDDTFIPGLSILDSFMFEDAAVVAGWMGSYELS